MKKFNLLIVLSLWLVAVSSFAQKKYSVYAVVSTIRKTFSTHVMMKARKTMSICPQVRRAGTVLSIRISCATWLRCWPIWAPTCCLTWDVL